MLKTMKVTCNLGHEHEIDVPDDLISIAEAARISHRTMQTIQTHIKTGAITGYPVSRSDNPYAGRGTRLPNTLISRKQLLTLYPYHPDTQAS